VPFVSRLPKPGQSSGNSSQAAHRPDENLRSATMRNEFDHEEKQFRQKSTGFAAAC
jgi:hypothetical protein